MNEASHENGWTGGQYSLFRAIFGAYLLVHFTNLIPWGAEMYSNRGVLPDATASPLIRLFPNILGLIDSPAMVTALLVIAAACAACFAVGWRDRIAAIILWYLWACFFGRNPLTSNPGLPYVGLMLLAHALLPRAPFGSLDARGRTDPAGDWFMSRSVFAVVWILMAAGYTYSGLMKLSSPSWLDGSAMHHVLENPLARPTALRDGLLALPPVVLRAMTWLGLALEIGFAPLALLRRLRPFVWLAGLYMHVSLMVLIDFADLSLGMVMLHLFTVTPAWIRPASAPAQTTSPTTIFYDGHCGLCHGWVRFVLSEDRAKAFEFAALQSDRFKTLVSPSQRAALPDSIAVLTGAGLLTRSDAILFILGALGGAWRVIAAVARLVPRSARNAVYDLIAAIRHRVFARPADACPLLPPHLRARFAD